MRLPPDLLHVLLHMWLGAMPLVAGVCALGAIHLWRRARVHLARRREQQRRAAMRARLSRAYFATATVVAVKGVTHTATGARASLLLAVQAPDGEYPVAADWLVSPEVLARLRPDQALSVLVLAGLPRRVLLNEGNLEPGAKERGAQAVQRSYARL
jgi:hypothetical protein